MKSNFFIQPAFAFCSPLTFLIFSLTLLQTHITLAQNSKALKDDSLFTKFRAATNNKNETYFIIKRNASTVFAKENPELMRALSANVSIVKGKPARAKESGIVAVAVADDLWKLSPALSASPTLFSNKEQTFLISALNILKLAEDLLRRRVAVKLLGVVEPYQSAVITCSGNFLRTNILPHPNVIFADLFLKPTPEILVIGYNRRLQNINRFQHAWPEVNGKGTTIGIKEQKMSEVDIDLLKRVKNSTLAATATDEHASVVATLAGGAGNSFYSGKGIAWQCDFYPSSFSNLFPDDAQVLAQHKVWVQNHSYGTVIQNFYGAEAQAYDLQTSQNKNIVHVFASGNRGQEAATQGTYSGLRGFANLTGNFKMAKNIITVAATDTGGSIAPFSSAGPLYDGRLGPQLAALGASGTSDAAAIVSGTVAVLQQVYKDSNGQALPPASLLKSILFNTADDIGSRGIDYHSGYGSLNIFNAIQLMRQRKFDVGLVAQGQSWTKNISLPTKLGQLKITLAWTDTAATLNSFKSLVNDLDLQLIELNTGKVYLPWCLSQFAAIDSLNLLPQRGRDSVNTAEQLSVDLPAAGSYQVKVNGRQITGGGAQAFHIAYSWDTLGTFNFTSPVNASDLDRDENPNLSITWESVESDTSKQGELWVSYNSGNNWKLIANSVKLSAGRYSWPLPDTASRTIFRMDNGSGSFYSKEFMLAPLTKLSVSYLCTDSMQLIWNKYVDAVAYHLYALTDSPYLKLVATLADTLLMLPRNSSSSQLYAVQPVTSSGLFASRSYAIDVRKQGVNCFYKTLLAENNLDKIDLILHLSSTVMADSIVFEKLDQNGRLLRILGSNVVTTGSEEYTAEDLRPVAGLNYYRATIVFSNGKRIITDTVRVLSNGKKLLYLYPNPVEPGQQVVFQLRDFSPGLTLQITDVMGRLVRTETIGATGKIDTRKLVAGLYLVTILKDGQYLETGKLLISH